MITYLIVYIHSFIIRACNPVLSFVNVRMNHSYTYVVLDLGMTERVKATVYCYWLLSNLTAMSTFEFGMQKARLDNQSYLILCMICRFKSVLPYLPLCFAILFCQVVRPVVTTSAEPKEGKVFLTIFSFKTLNGTYLEDSSNILWVGISCVPS